MPLYKWLPNEDAKIKHQSRHPQAHRQRAPEASRDSFPRGCLHEDLHASTQAQYQMERGLLLDVVIGKCATILQLFARKNQSLLIWRDAFFVLYLCLHIVDCI